MSSKNDGYWRSAIEFYRQQLSNYDKDVRQLSTVAGLSEKTLREALKQIPKKRETVLMLCYALRVNRTEADDLLMCAGYPKLYAKNADDVIWIYMLNNRSRMEQKSAAQLHNEYYLEYEKELDREVVQEKTALGTDIVDRRLDQVETEDDFTRFISAYLPELADRYKKLRNYLCQVAGVDNPFQALSLVPDSRKGVNAYKRISDAKKSKARTNRVRLNVLQRDFLIAVGLELSLCVDAINELLKKGYCEELDPKGDNTERLIEVSLIKAELDKPGSTIGWIRGERDKNHLEVRMDQLLSANDLLHEYNGTGPVSEYVYSILEVNECENIPRLL